MKEMKSINRHNAQLMHNTNVATRLYKAIDQIGIDAVSHIKLLLPVGETFTDMYAEFPNNGAITIPHPTDRNSVEVKRIFLNGKYELCAELDLKKSSPYKTIVLEDHYGAMDMVNLLNSLLIHYGRN